MRGGEALLYGLKRSGAALAGLIVLYDAHHKGTPLSPLIMGLCRVFVYLTAAFAVAIRSQLGLRGLSVAARAGWSCPAMTRSRPTARCT